ncbi:hypothetical protein [Xylocopilactobacillus apis]|uniref:Uncharacterized protein n=1 Tax=Xylocopilactobacillus apis TaxID=2932183 RepID=A0AAU9CNE2_9LACO|nr:hypothetical protein [Xylocopilactobacillus apis]BDR55454.1 hypothetical protein KIMC2_00160 [Xylocopilactobacillus apis]
MSNEFDESFDRYTNLYSLIKSRIKEMPAISDQADKYTVIGMTGLNDYRHIWGEPMSKLESDEEFRGKALNFVTQRLVEKESSDRDKSAECGIYLSEEQADELLEQTNDPKEQLIIKALKRGYSVGIVAFALEIKSDEVLNLIQ